MSRYTHPLSQLEALLEEERFLEARIAEQRKAPEAMAPLPVHWRKVRCGKERCRRCPHGPYPYLRVKKDDRWRWQYLGKGWQPPEGFTRPEAFRQALARYRRLLERLLDLRERLVELDKFLKG